MRYATQPVIGDGFYKWLLHFAFMGEHVTEQEWTERKRQHGAIQDVLFPSGLGRRLTRPPRKTEEA